MSALPVATVADEENFLLYAPGVFRRVCVSLVGRSGGEGGEGGELQRITVAVYG